MRKIFISFLSLLLIFSVCAAPIAGSAAYPLPDIEVSSKYIYMVNVDTDTVVFDVDSHVKAYPASTTKIMTCLVAMKHCPDLANTMVTVNPKALSDLWGTDSSVAGLKSGEVMSMLDMLYCLMLPSGNDAALAIAYFLSPDGTIASFVEMMNDEAQALGCNDTHFANPHGLHDDDHYTTAYDLYLIAREAMNFPVFKEIVKTQSYTIYPTNLSKQRSIANPNYMLNRFRESYYAPTTGIKTGSTSKAGYCLVSSASKNGFTYILVTLNAPMEKYGLNLCFADAKKIFMWSFNNLTLTQVVTEGEIIAEVPVELAWNIDHVSLAPVSDYKALLPKTVSPSSVLVEIEKEAKVTAPVKQGDILGKATLIYANSVIGEVELAATEDIERSQFLYILSVASKIVTSPIFIICMVSVVALVAAYIALVRVKNKKNYNRHKHFSAKYGGGSYNDRRYY
ncbi:MAG: D-alanyl-D-alanine carboxypeptidase [Clostridia bacterium]|nr:D-alanyl-D-alanine carboxypeptidase [Clostridia bacterium]